MKRIIFETFWGIILSISGIYVAYLYLQGIDQGSNPLLLIASILLMGFGVFSLFHAGKLDDTVVKKLPVEENLPVETKPGFEKILERNNQISDEWNKTNDQRDRLHMMGLADSGDKT